MDHSPPGSSIHEIFQARVLEWGAIAFSIIGPQKKNRNKCVVTGGKSWDRGLNTEIKIRQTSLLFIILGDIKQPLDCREIQPVHSEGDQPWVFFGGNDATVETPVLWPPHAKS